MKQFIKLLSCLPIVIVFSGCLSMTLPGMIASKLTEAKQEGTLGGKPPLDIYIKELGQREDILEIALEAGKKLDYSGDVAYGLLWLGAGSVMPNIITGKAKSIDIIVCTPRVDKNGFLNDKYYIKYYTPQFDKGIKSIFERAITSNALYIEIRGYEDFVSDPKNHFKNLLQQYVDTLWALVKEKDMAKK